MWMKCLDCDSSLFPPVNESVLKRRRTSKTSQCESQSTQVVPIDLHVAYSGSKEGCTFIPLYLQEFSIRAGTRSPKETAITRSVGCPCGLGG